MVRRFAACLAIVLVPSLAWAQAGPERLVPANSQVFFRWDGFSAQRAAYEKTAVGKMMAGDTGKFLDALWDWINETAELAGQADPQAPALIKEALKTVSGIGRNGLTVSVAAKAFMPPQAQLTLVFPKAADKDGTLLPLINKLTGLAMAPVQIVKAGKRDIHHFNAQFVQIAWWAEGDDAVILVGTDDPAAYAKMIDGNETGLASNPLYKQVASFKEFPITARGFLDIAALAKMGSDISPEAGRLVEDLGLKGVKSVSFVSGYDGLAERAITEIDVPGPRKGLLALASQKKISLANLPPLPDDVTSFSASNFNAGKVYDTGVQVVEAVVRMFAPEQADNVKEGLRQLEGILGVRIEDLFGSFDDTMVGYNSPSEGLLGLGSVNLFKVKDEKKLRDSLDSLLKAVPNIPGANIEVKKRMYHGVEISEISLNIPGNPVGLASPSFAIHKGWLIIGSYPQGIYGYILRSNGELPVWQPDAKLTKALAAFPKEFTGISVSDPRPTVKFVLSALPPLIGFGNNAAQFLPGLRPFDLGLIPHAQAATQGLFPNITVTTDDGKKIRSETRASLALPF